MENKINKILFYTTWIIAILFVPIGLILSIQFTIQCLLGFIIFQIIYFLLKTENEKPLFIKYYVLEICIIIYMIISLFCFYPI